MTTTRTPRPWLKHLALSICCLSMAACQQSTNTGTTPTPTTAEPVNIGSPLYKAEKPEAIAIATTPEASIVIANAIMRLDKKQQIPAEVDGKIEVIGVPLPPGTQFDPADSTLVFEFDDTAHNRPFRRLREGDRVKVGQEVCLINDLDVRVQLEASRKLKIACDEAIVTTNAAANAIQKQLDQQKKLSQTGASSLQELLTLEATYARYQENVIQSQKEKVKAEGDEKRAVALQIKHRAKSFLNGVVTKVYREPGEAVRAGDPIMEVLSTEEVRIEGNIEAEMAVRVVPGMKVIVEPTMPVGPDLKLGVLEHGQTVTGVVVTSHKNQPLVISSSLDGSIGVWNAFPAAGKPRTQVRLMLPDRVGVHSVATTGAKVAKPMLASGSADGKVRLWDVSNPDKISDKPLKELDVSHTGGVVALAFSPDGKYLASAAGREVYIFDVNSGNRLYSLPADHKDAITGVHFTPQATLVTVGRDRTMRVWKVGDQNASLDQTFEHRKGIIDTLGISSGGGRALFDVDDARIDVVSLTNGLSVGGSIQNNGPAARFSSLAIFTPDDQWVLTASGDGEMKGELQLWTTPPAGGRGSERMRLVTPNRAMPTCAAFGPDGEQWFVAIGTQNRGVHIWTKDSLTAQHKVREGRVASVLRIDPKTVKVRVEAIAAPGEIGGVLQDKATATIIIKPGEMMSSPSASGTRPMGVVPVGARSDEVGPLVPASPTSVEFPK